MDNKLKPNQEKKVIENFVECIMDDLDYYHFDELIMEKYKKELFQFFTKISEERSLFSPGFDFSNKKNIVNDKEKIEEAVKYINEIMAWRKTEEYPHGVQNKTFTRATLEEIKKILEK
jgi:hypothetical protein